MVTFIIFLISQTTCEFIIIVNKAFSLDPDFLAIDLFQYFYNIIFHLRAQIHRTEVYFLFLSCVDADTISSFSRWLSAYLDTIY
jgi:hypothetical protein